jgi:hypothetical protein
MKIQSILLSLNIFFYNNLFTENAKFNNFINNVNTNVKYVTFYLNI